MTFIQYNGHYYGIYSRNRRPFEKNDAETCVAQFHNRYVHWGHCHCHMLKVPISTRKKKSISISTQLNMKNSQCNLSALEAFVSLVECNHHQVHTAGTNTGFCKEKIEICTNPPIYASSCKATQNRFQYLDELRCSTSKQSSHETYEQLVDSAYQLSYVQSHSRTVLVRGQVNGKIISFKYRHLSQPLQRPCYMHEVGLIWSC